MLGKRLFTTHCLAETARGDSTSMFRTMHPALVWIDLSTKKATLEADPGQGTNQSLAFTSDGRSLAAINGAGQELLVLAAKAPDLNRRAGFQILAV